MSDATTVVYIDQGPVGAAVATLAPEARFRLIRAETGMDALKRVHTERVDALVLPASMADVGATELVDKVRETDPTIDVVVVGTAGHDDIVGELPPDVVTIPETDAERTVANRLRTAIGDRRVDQALHRHERLEVAGLRLAQAAVAAGDRSAIESVVHDELVDSGTYRFVWVGRYRPDSQAVEVSQPFPGRFSLASIAETVGADDGNFLAEAVETGRATVQRSDSPTRSTATPKAGDVAAGRMTFAAVPFANADRCHGVMVLGTTEPGALDSTERTLLERVGSIVGYALATADASPADRTGSPERIQRFVDVLAHELRNPLQIAVSYLAIGREHDEDEAFERVAEAHETIGEIIDAAVSLVEEGGVDEIVPVDLDVAAKEVWSGLDAPEASLSTVDPPTVRADPDALDRVLSNLFRNAIDHGGPDVSVTIGSLPEGAGFYVEDDGPGIPPEDRDDVFEWGFSTSESGLGIGLGFVREIVEAHGWRINVAAGRAGGARFEVHTDAGESAATATDDAGLEALFDDWEPGGRTGSFEFPE